MGERLPEIEKEAEKEKTEHRKHVELFGTLRERVSEIREKAERKRIEPRVYEKWLYIGCGGAGGRILDLLSHEDNILAINTSRDDLNRLSIPFIHKLLIRETGRGCGGDRELGERIVEKKKEDIEKKVEEKIIKEREEKIYKADECLLITSLGGGTGSTVSPFIADYIKERREEFGGLNIISFAVLPFCRDDKSLQNNSLKAIKELTKSSDLTIIVENGMVTGKKRIGPINKEIVKIIYNVTYPKRYPFGKVLDLSDIKRLQPHDEEYLFNIDAAGLENDLNKGIFSEKLKKEFEKKALLSEKPVIVKEDDKWKIIDIEKEKTYTVRKEDGELKIYNRVPNSVMVPTLYSIIKEIDAKKVNKIDDLRTKLREKDIKSIFKESTALFNPGSIKDVIVIYLYIPEEKMKIIEAHPAEIRNIFKEKFKDYIEDIGHFIVNFIPFDGKSFDYFSLYTVPLKPLMEGYKKYWKSEECVDDVSKHRDEIIDEFFKEREITEG